jgi:23S rRNA (cytosine1962-C5)-methyltransferase
MNARRYQLRKDAAAIVERGHPWIFREQLSSAASIFTDGQWLRLVDGQNKVVGHGIYEADGAIAIRLLRRGDGAPDAAWLSQTLDAALARRSELAARTDGIRLLHGESDGIPAVVADRFGDTIVVSSYSIGADGLARYIAHALRTSRSPVVGPATHVMLRPARRRRGPSLPARTLRGTPPPVAHFTEDTLAFAVDLEAGHKTGTYLDLRALRRELARPPQGPRVLNLFAYSGMLGRAVEAAGATEIVQVDQSERALAFAAAHHIVAPAKHRFVTADIFEWLPALAADEMFDVIIVDPPSMTSKKAQVPQVLAAYKKLYTAAKAHLRPSGLIVAACCTSRVERREFSDLVRKTLGGSFSLAADLPPEPDHPVGFPQADYLKILLMRQS